jgi:hypothetical protein
VLLALAGYGHLSWRRADPARAEVFLASQLRAVQDRATVWLASSPRRPQRPSLRSGKGPQSWAFRCFGSLEGQAGSGSVAGGPPFSVVAWSGPLRDAEADEPPPPARSSSSPASPPAWWPWRRCPRRPAASGARHGRDRRARAPQHRNEYLADFDLLSDGLPGVEFATPISGFFSRPFPPLARPVQPSPLRTSRVDPRDRSRPPVASGLRGPCASATPVGARWASLRFFSSMARNPAAARACSSLG